MMIMTIMTIMSMIVMMMLMMLTMSAAAAIYWLMLMSVITDQMTIYDKDDDHSDDEDDVDEDAENVGRCGTLLTDDPTWLETLASPTS